jgi:hypothetical protein
VTAARSRIHKLWENTVHARRPNELSLNGGAVAELGVGLQFTPSGRHNVLPVSSF